MKRPRPARTSIVALLTLGAAAFVAVLLSRSGDPDHVWLLAFPSATTGDFRHTPDGDPVPHAATMQDEGNAWAYYYRPRTRLLDTLDRLGIGPGITVDFVATGRTETTASGVWREYRRATSDEMMRRLGRRRGGKGYNG